MGLPMNNDNELLTDSISGGGKEGCGEWSGLKESCLMAGEAVSRTSLTLAFQKKQDLEWRKLREHLHLQLQQDIGRIYTNSLYCDLELVFSSTSVQTHCSILQVRAARFFTKLCSFQPAAPHTVVLDDAAVDYIESFIRSLYTKCAVTDEEGAVQYLEELHNLAKGGDDSGLSPESDVYLTPNCSPSEIYHHFDVTKTHSLDNTKSASAETLINLQKTNQSYYTIVPVDEAFIEESNSNKSREVCNILEKELAEQDELLKSFHSIKSKEDKQSSVKKINKPTSLLFTSSQYTKKYKRGCDITYTRYKKEGKDLLESKLQPSSCGKEDLASLNASQSVHKEQNNSNLLRINSLKKDRYLGDKFESRENTIQEEEERETSKNTRGVSKNSDYRVQLENSANNNDILEEEEFMESPGEGVDCELECCKNKDLTAEDLLNFPCSPEMDASGGGPDSGLDTSSTGCMPGGGLSSPRDHTVSETSGIDLTEAAIGEDMPHDGDIDILLRKPVKSSTSSSVSSDAGTWDSTFPATHVHDTHVTELDCVTGCVVPSDGMHESVRDPCDKEKYVISTKPSQYEATVLYSDEPQTDNISKLETNRQLNMHHAEEKHQNLEVKLTQENTRGAHSYSHNVCMSPENIPPRNMCNVSSLDHWSSHAEGNTQELLPTGPESIVLETSFQASSSSDKLTESLPFCSEDAHGWKLSNQNNYFINAADLADDDMLLPPPTVASEQQDTITADTDTSELETQQKSSSAASPCEEHISTCDIVNKGITDCLNIKAKCTAVDTLPVEAHAEAFCEDVVPFLTSHINATNETVVMNDLEHVTENNFKTTNEYLASDPPMMRVTPVRVAAGKDEVQVSIGQDVFAEFQKEIKVTEHLEPHVNIRKLHGGWKRTDSASSEDLSKRESQSLPACVFSECTKPEIQDEIDIADVSEEEKDNDASSKEGSFDQVASTVCSSKQNNETETETGQLDEKKEEEAEARRPSLIRRNTFELDPDDDRLALLRQDYERRQGNLLFQSCIPQFSGHLTGSEGFRDTQSLLLVTSKDEDLNKGEAQQRSLPAVTHDTSLTETSLCVSNRSEGQVMSSETSITDSSPVALPSCVFSNRDIHMLDSVSNDRPLESLFHSQMNHIPLSQQSSESQQFSETVDHDLKYPEEKNFLDVGNSKNKSYVQSNHNRSESEKEQDVERTQKGDLKRMSNSFDNSTKPVISGALTCSDVMVDDKRPCDTPKKQKRTESTPIVSGGVSSIDFVVPARPVLDSPIMARRKNESAPILSGGATVIEPEPQKVQVKSSANVASVNSAWVVDMSDCSSSAAKPPIEPRRQKKSNVAGNTAQSCEVKGTSQHKQSEMKTTALGFFVDLKDATTDCQTNKKPRKEIINDGDFKSHESSPGRRNSGVGFFVDLKEPKEPANKRLMPAEGKEVSYHIKADEPKSVTKNASCGFFVNLDKNSVNEQITESKKLVGTGDDKNDNKNTLFSMFIDIGETSVKQESSVDSSQGKMSSPHLSSRKKLAFRSQTEMVSSTDSSQTCAHTVTNNNANVEAAPQVVSKSPSQDETENKKQGFFMFIEAESPVTRRKTLPSNLRSNLNRHSLNLEPRVGEQGDDQQKGNGRGQHKRAHSLSVERSSVCSPDKSRSLSSTSLAKSKVRSSSQSLHEAVTSPDQSSLTQFGDETDVKEMSVSSHCRLPSKSYDQAPKRSVSYEEKSGSSKETPDTDTLSGRKLLNTSASLLPVTCTESKGASSDFIMPQSCTLKNKRSDISTAEAAGPSHQNVAITQEEGENMRGNSSEPTDLQRNEHNEDVLAVAEGRSLDENVSVQASAESEALAKDSCMETNSKSLETSFVKLSDLDKEPPKTISAVTGSSDVLPSFAAANRMTRSIPETSWIENKLLMTRSIGGGTSSRSLSRLFPHLHTTVNAASSPSNTGRSKSPSTQPDADDNDTQVSETSDLSSMQSSMGPSGLEGSTEETDASSSYAGRSGPVSRLGEDLLRMFLEEINPDVTVEVGGRRLKAHKCILSSRCQYFAAILSGGWVESAGNVISLQGFSYNAVHFALCHIYSGTSNIPDTISIVELATLADMLGLEGLKEVIMYTLKVKYCHFFHKPCTMCAAGVLECLPLAAAYGLDDIYRKSLRWITRYFVRIWPTKGFASLPRELIDKCYQQHVVHMTVDNVLETVMCCDKLLATLPNVRWAEPVFGITSQLLEASIKYIANNFSSVLSSDSFLSLGKELSWNISRLEDSLMAATDRLPPDQACQSHTRLHNILTVARSSEPPPEMQWSPSFVELLNRIQKRVEVSLVRQAPRAARCPSWGQMELELRKKIQEAACLVLVPTEEGHRSRHASLAKRGEAGSSSSVSYTATRSISSSGSHSLDLRQVKLAMTQQARRAASGGRVSTLKADTKSRLQSAKKSQSSTHVPPHKAETLSSQAKKVVSENGESTSRPKTWPLRVLENKSKSATQRANSSSSSMGTPEKSVAMPRRAAKAVISSSDSSRTSSPAMKRSTSSGEGSGRGRAATVGNATSRTLVRRSETPPGKEMRSKKRKDSEVTAMSTDSLNEVQSNGGDQHLAKDAGDTITSQGCLCTRPDTPSVRQRLGEEVVMSADSLAESVASGEKLSAKTKASACVPSHSLGSTRPDTPPIKDRGRKCLGRIGMEATVSTDVLAATEQSFAGETSTVRKIDVAKTVPVPKSPTSRGPHTTSSRFDGGKGNLVKGAKNGDTKNEITQPKSPAATARRVVMRQTIVSPRDSPTFRVRSGVTSSPYAGSPSLRRSLLLATRSPTNDSACSGNMTSSSAKPEKAVKSLCSQSATISASKRAPTRLQTRNQPLASPVKCSSESGRGVTRGCGREAVRGNTGGKGITDVSKANNNATRKVISNGSVHGKNRQNNNEVSTPNKRGESSEEKPLSVGSRSGTFLKDEPTVLKKPNVDNVQE